MKKSLLTYIDELLDVPKTTYKSDPKFRPSSLGSPCLRKIYYSYNNVEPDYGFPLKAKKIMNLGDSVHELLGDYFRKAGILIDYKNKDGSRPIDRFDPSKYDDEFPLKDKDLEVSAKIDAILRLDGELEIGEWKSINTKGFSYLKKPKDEHVIQAAIYFYLFNKALKDGKYDHIEDIKPKDQVKRVRFLYYNKDNSEMREFICEEPFLAPYFKAVIEKMQLVKSATDNKQLPPMTKDWCQSCNWRDKCFKNYVAD